MKNKKGKKLVVLGAMAALLTLIGVSGSQTYAKYIETAQVPSQTATVAKWGFVQNVTADNLFGSTDGYGDADALFLTKPVTTVNAKTGTSSDATYTTLTAQADDVDHNIVQPGGSGSLTFEVTGKAEVAASFSFSGNLTSDICLDDSDGGLYNPVKWAVEVTGDYSLAKTGWGTFANVVNSLNTVDFYASPNADVDFLVTVYWKWDFSNTAECGVDDLVNSGTTPVLTGDEADTILAVLSNMQDSLQYDYSDLQFHYCKAGSKTSTNLSFDLSLTAQQVQVNA